MKYGQAGKPHGIIGKIMGRLMEKMNGTEVPATISRLHIEPNDHVLEIGFGPGKSFKAISKLLETGKIYGIDHSETMLQMAKKNNTKLIEEGKLNLRLGSVEELDFAAASIDKVLTINCIYFWKDAVGSLKKIHTILAENGVLAITVRNSKHGLNKLYTRESLRDLLQESGYADVKIELLGKENLIIAIGKK